MTPMRTLGAASLLLLLSLSACGKDGSAASPAPTPTIGAEAACMLVEDAVTGSVAIWADPNATASDLSTLRGYDAGLRDTASRLGADPLAAQLIALADANADLTSDGDAESADFRAAAADVAAACGF